MLCSRLLLTVSANAVNGDPDKTGTSDDDPTDDQPNKQSFALLRRGRGKEKSQGSSSGKKTDKERGKSLTGAGSTSGYFSYSGGNTPLHPSDPGYYDAVKEQEDKVKKALGGKKNF